MISKQAGNYFKTIILRKPSGSLARLIVNGSSMWPFLRHGQEVMVRKVIGNKNISIGDIVVINVKNFFLVHRVLFKRKSKEGKGWEYFTKGDKRFVADGWTGAKNVVGIVPTRRIGRILNSLIAGYSFGLLLIGKIINRNISWIFFKRD